MRMILQFVLFFLIFWVGYFTKWILVEKNNGYTRFELFIKKVFRS